MGAFSMVAVENMDMKDVQKLEKEFEKVPHVRDVLWYDDVADISLPTEMIPKDIRKAFINGDATMMLVLFDDTTSSDNSMDITFQDLMDRFSGMGNRIRGIFSSGEFFQQCDRRK